MFVLAYLLEVLEEYDLLLSSGVAVLAYTVHCTCKQFMCDEGEKIQITTKHDKTIQYVVLINWSAESINLPTYILI